MEKNTKEKTRHKCETIYRKGDSGRYIPFGIHAPGIFMSDGLWLVRHTEGTSSISNVKYLEADAIAKIGDAYKDKITIDDVCSAEEYANYIMESEEYKTLVKAGYSLNDFVHLCVMKALQRTMELKNKQQ